MLYFLLANRPEQSPNSRRIDIQIMLPQGKDPIPPTIKKRPDSPPPGPVPLYLFSPKFPICLGQPKMPRASVPEAAVHKYAKPGRLNQKVRPAPNLRLVLKGNSLALEKALQKNFGPSIEAPYFRHYFRSFLFRHNIHNQLNYTAKPVNSQDIITLNFKKLNGFCQN